MSQLLTSELLRRLALGELSNLKMGDAGTIAAAEVPKILVHVNHALRDIFTRFLLSQKEVIINTNETLTHYYLRWEFAQSNTGSAQPAENRYIDDASCDGFEHGLSKILKVYDAFGRELFMNKTQEPLSVFTPFHDCLQITANHQTEDFFVIFQALHPTVNYDTTPDPDIDTLINIPPALETPLQLLTASKVYGNLNGQANATRSLTLKQDYEMSLIENEVRDSMSTSENMSNGKLDLAGFV